MKRVGFALFCISCLLFVVYSAAPDAVPQQPAASSELEAALAAQPKLTPRQQQFVDAFSTGDPRMVCFAPGTPEYFQQQMDAATTVAMTKAFMKQRLTSNYVAFNRWGTTATDGTTGPTGTGVTLTWSIVPDGTPISSGQSEPNTPSDLRAWLNSPSMWSNEATWLPFFQYAFDQWEAESGIDFVYITEDDMATAGGSGASGQLGIRADIRITGHYIDGDGDPDEGNILAYNYFPSNGDMVIDTAGDYLNPSVHGAFVVEDRLKNVLVHEIGHGLGLKHVCPKNNQKIMEPVLTTAVLGPQHDDIRGVQKQYGDINGANNEKDNATAVTLIHGTQATISDVSIDSISEVDFYKITTTQAGVLTVTATPAGSTYYVAAHNNLLNPTCQGLETDSTSVENLEITVYEDDGLGDLTVVKQVDNWAIGKHEKTQAVRLNSIGDYFIAISSSGGDGSVQLYDLNLTLGDEVYSMGVPTDETNLDPADLNLSGATLNVFNGTAQLHETATDVDTKRGYWVKIGSYSPDFSGRSVTVGSVSFDLDAGWNLLSLPSGECIEWDTSVIEVDNGGGPETLATAAANGWVDDYAWYYDQSSGEYLPIYDSGLLSSGDDHIEGGRAFWFYSNSGSATLIFDVPLSGVCQITDPLFWNRP